MNALTATNAEEGAEGELIYFQHQGEDRQQERSGGRTLELDPENYGSGTRRQRERERERQYERGWKR
ncbi:hypothetical protein HLB42_21960 (plasmid) [Deinococcus sp. D7000]|nr:hypothetical protein HLB42_21960 [Deinococcus sp. D7000]